MNIDASPFIQILDEGYSSEIVYTVRMRKKNISGAFTTPSGRNSWTITKKAAKEYLTDMYLLDSNGVAIAYENAVEFIGAFFTCRIPVPAEYYNSSAYLLEAKASADLIKRPRPLSLLDPFLRSEITDTGWFRLGN